MEPDISTARAADPGERLIGLQWLRAIAAAMVVVHHALFSVNAAQGLGEDAERSLFGFANWAFGVNIFFLVSGFIMMTSTKAFGERGAPSGFLVKRLVRIVPLYWIVTTVGLLTVLASPGQLPIAHEKISYVLQSYLFIPVLRAPGDMRPLVGQGWTLTYEMFFYLVFAISLALPRRRALLWMSLLFLELSVIGRGVGLDNPVAFTWTDALNLEFLFGVYIGYAYLEGARLPPWLRLACIAAGFAGAALKLAGPSFLVTGVPASLILAGFALGPQPSPTPAALWFASVGDASYSLYLTHTFLLRLVAKAWSRIGASALPGAAFVAAALVVTISASLAVYRFVELPLTRRLRRWTRSGAPERGPAPAADPIPRR